MSIYFPRKIISTMGKAREGAGRRATEAKAMQKINHSYQQQISVKMLMHRDF